VQTGVRLTQGHHAAASPRSDSGRLGVSRGASGCCGRDLIRSFVVLGFCGGGDDVCGVCEVGLGRELPQGMGHRVQQEVEV